MWTDSDVRTDMATIAHAPVLIAQGWIAEALTSEYSLLCAAMVFLCLLILLMLTRVIVRLGRAQAAARQRGSHRLLSRLGSFLSDDRGTTSIEFALVFPILLVITLIMVQSMMMMAGNIYVHYAAFVATRAATIEIPQDYTDRGDYEADYYAPGKGSIKHERIRRAAYMALVPVAGQSDGGTGPSGEVVSAISSHFSTYGSNEPMWVQAKLAAKVGYAESNTEIELLETLVQSDNDVTFDPLPENPYRFGVRDVITVRVIHKLNLGVPFASRFFADGDNDAKGPGRYTLVTARATFTNEGVPNKLPEKPDIDRVTPTLSPILNNNGQIIP